MKSMQRRFAREFKLEIDPTRAAIATHDRRRSFRCLTWPRFAVAACLLLSLFPAAALGQGADSTRRTSDALRVFIDCEFCDLEFLRKEITFINHVRNRQVAQVHVLDLCHRCRPQRIRPGGKDDLDERGGCQGRQEPFGHLVRRLKYAGSGGEVDVRNVVQPSRVAEAETGARQRRRLTYPSRRGGRVGRSSSKEGMVRPGTSSRFSTTPAMSSGWIFQASASLGV